MLPKPTSVGRICAHTCSNSHQCTQMLDVKCECLFWSTNATLHPQTKEVFANHPCTFINVTRCNCTYILYYEYMCIHMHLWGGEGGAAKGGGALSLPLKKEFLHKYLKLINVDHSTFTLPSYMYYSVYMYMYNVTCTYLHFHSPWALIFPTSIVAGTLPFLSDVVFRTTLASSMRSFASGIGSSWGSENRTATLIRL